MIQTLTVLLYGKPIGALRMLNNGYCDFEYTDALRASGIQPSPLMMPTGGRRIYNFPGLSDNITERDICEVAKAQSIRNPLEILDEVDSAVSRFAEYATEAGVAEEETGQITKTIKEKRKTLFPSAHYFSPQHKKSPKATHRK